MNLLKKISDLVLGTPLETDVIPYVDLVTGTTKKAYKSDLKGLPGDNGTVDVNSTTTLPPGSSATVVNVGTTLNALLDFGIPAGSVIYSTILIPDNSIGLDGDWAFSTSSTSNVFYKSGGAWALVNSNKGVQGDTGNGIASIVLTSTLGLVDTYTITYDDATTTTFDVTNGEKGDVGDAGNGIVSITLINTVGKVKTYQILYTDTTTFNYDVTDGADGEGSGDVLGPATNHDGYIPQWDGVDSKTLKEGIPTSTFAPALGEDDNYVTDTEKALINGLDTKAIDLDLGNQGLIASNINITDPTLAFTTSIGANNITADRQVELPDKDGTVAFLDDIGTGSKTYSSEVSSATPTIDTDVLDRYELTAQAEDITSFTTNLTGTPVSGDKLNIKITQDGNIDPVFINQSTATASATNVILTVNIPVNTQEGDVMIAMIKGNNANTGYLNSVVPEGWTLLASNNPGTFYYQWWYKVAGASEPASYQWKPTNNTSQGADGYIGTWRGGFDKLNPIYSASNVSYTTNNQTIKYGSHTIPFINSKIIILGGGYMGGTNTMTPPTAPSGATWTERYEGSIGNGVTYVAETVWSSSGATGEINSTSGNVGTTKTGLSLVFNKAGYNIAWGTSFNSADYLLPVSIPPYNTKSLDLNFKWNSVTSKWDTYWLQNKSKASVGSFDVASATGTKKYIQHNLGRVPKRVRIKTMCVADGSQSSESFGVMDNLTENSSVYMATLEGTSTATSDLAGNNSTYAVMAVKGSLSNYSGGVVSADENWIIITITKTGSPTGTAYVLCEAE